MTDPTGAQSGTGETAQSGGSANQGTGTATGESAQSGATTQGTANSGTGDQSAQSGDTVSRADYDRLRAQLQQADRRFSETENQLKQIRDKDMPELAKAQRDLQEANGKVEALEAKVNSLTIENAFLTDNTHEWHNPATAMQLLDRSKISVDSDGKVLGMKDALTALARSDAYLLKPKTGDQGQGQGQQGQGQGQGARPPAGTPPANGGIGGGSGGTSSLDDLKHRIPALKRKLSG